MFVLSIKKELIFVFALVLQYYLFGFVVAFFKWKFIASNLSTCLRCTLLLEFMIADSECLKYKKSQVSLSGSLHSFNY